MAQLNVQQAAVRDVMAGETNNGDRTDLYYYRLGGVASSKHGISETCISHVNVSIMADPDVSPTHIHTYTHNHTHTYIYTYTHTLIHTRTYSHTHAHDVYTNIHTHTHIHT